MFEGAKKDIENTRIVVNGKEHNIGCWVKAGLVLLVLYWIVKGCDKLEGKSDSGSAPSATVSEQK